VRTEAFFGKLFRNDPSETTRKKYQDRVDQINVLEPQMQALSDDQLRAKTDEFKRRVAGGESLEAILPEAFAVSGPRGQQEPCNGCSAAAASAPQARASCRARPARLCLRLSRRRRRRAPPGARPPPRRCPCPALHRRAPTPRPAAPAAAAGGARGLQARAGPAPL
jgi:hypothetical protein